MPVPGLNIAVIVGSTREGRFGPTVADWFVGLARQRTDMTIDVIDLTDVDVPSVYPRRGSASIEAYVERLADARAASPYAA